MLDCGILKVRLARQRKAVDNNDALILKSAESYGRSKFDLCASSWTLKRGRHPTNRQERHLRRRYLGSRLQSAGEAPLNDDRLNPRSPALRTAHNNISPRLQHCSPWGVLHLG